MKKILLIIFMLLLAGAGYIWLDWHAYNKRRDAGPAETLYSWTDSGGTTRHSNSPPPDGSKNVRKQKTNTPKYQKPPLIRRITSAVSSQIGPGMRKKLDAMEARIRKTLPMGTLEKTFDKHKSLLPVAIIAAVLFLACIPFFFLIRHIFLYTGPAIRAGICLNRLEEPEQAILREFLIQDRDIIQVPDKDGTVSDLIKKGILKFVEDSETYSRIGALVSVSLSMASNRKIRPRHLGMEEFDETGPHLKTRPGFIGEIYPNSTPRRPS